MIGLRRTGHGGEYQAYRFTLEVSSPYKSAYKTEIVWEVFPLGASKVQVGLEINIKIDADDTMIVYFGINGVEYSWLGVQINRRK